VRFVPYHRIGGEPNVIVDGSATDGTVLALSHWPGTETASAYWADLSAEMAFRYLDQPELAVDDLTPIGPLSPDYPTRCGELYERSMPMLAELCDHPERFAELWEAEDATLSASEALIDAGVVGVEEVPSVDLAVITSREAAASAATRHPGERWPGGLHPMAVFGATSMLGICWVGPDSFRFE